MRNGYRWGPERGHDGRAAPAGAGVLRVVPNETTAANLLLTGGLNVATILGAERAGSTAGTLHADHDRAPAEFFFNEQPGRPGADASVRRALVQAMNLAVRHGVSPRAAACG